MTTACQRWFVRCSCGAITVLRVDDTGKFLAEDATWTYDGERLWFCGRDEHFQWGCMDAPPNLETA